MQTNFPEHIPCTAHRCFQDRQRKPVARHRSQPPTCRSPSVTGPAALCWAWTRGFLQRAPGWTCHDSWWPSQPEKSPDGPALDQGLRRRGRPQLFWEPWENYLNQKKKREENWFWATEKEVNYKRVLQVIMMCLNCVPTMNKTACAGVLKP